MSTNDFSHAKKRRLDVFGRGISENFKQKDEGSLHSSENISEEELKHKEIYKDIVYKAMEVVVNHKNFEEFLNNLDKRNINVNKLVNETLSKYDRSLLHIAVQYDNEMAVRDLIQNGASVNAVDKCNMTPLHLVESVNVAKVLIENNADLTAEDIHGRNVLSNAYGNENFQLARFLLEKKNKQLFSDALIMCGLPAWFSEADFLAAMWGDDLVFNKKNSD